MLSASPAFLLVALQWTVTSDTPPCDARFPGISSGGFVETSEVQLSTQGQLLLAPPRQISSKFCGMVGTTVTSLPSSKPQLRALLQGLDLHPGGLFLTCSVLTLRVWLVLLATIHVISSSLFFFYFLIPHHSNPRL